MKDKYSYFLPNKKSLNLSKELADKLNIPFNNDEVKKLSSNLHSIYFNEIADKINLDSKTVNFFSASTRHIRAFASNDGKKNNTIFFDEQFDFWLMDMCFLNSIFTFEEIKSQKRYETLLKIYSTVFKCFYSPYLHERIRDNIKPLLFTYPECTKFAHSISKAMIAFIICHEIAHVQLGHINQVENPNLEFDADKLAFEYYDQLLNSKNKKGYLVFNNKLLCLPIILMNYFSILEKFSYIKNGNIPSRNTHPNPISRAERLWLELEKRQNSETEYLLKVLLLGLKDIIKPLNLPKTI
ncbi:hypothetical protein [Psychroserpens sp. SPM9]|uniref:hypothetical protein n=1 Tax=Psychroserpens sp. SPM9 TaxID=2975598 RepID=UPI0021A8D276|nr:hypothetical protein [Psychroserpens sp. SPM9]MDG5490598.1 hypothetical protein [Psychroserpens sp. SPM9]